MSYYGGSNKYGSSKYSASEKKAYYSGQGYKLGSSGKAINFKNPANRLSFMNGYKSVDPKRYPDAKSKHK